MQMNNFGSNIYTAEQVFHMLNQSSLEFSINRILLTCKLTLPITQSGFIRSEDKCCSLQFYVQDFLVGASDIVCICYC